MNTEMKFKRPELWSWLDQGGVKYENWQKSGWTFYGSNTLRAAAFSSER